MELYVGRKKFSLRNMLLTDIGLTRWDIKVPGMAVNDRSIRRDESSAFNDTSICTLDSKHSSNNTTLTHSQTNYSIHFILFTHSQCGSLRSSPWSLVSPLARWPTPTPSLRMPRPMFSHVNIPTFTENADTLALHLAGAVRLSPSSFFDRLGQIASLTFCLLVR